MAFHLRRPDLLHGDHRWVDTLDGFGSIHGGLASDFWMVATDEFGRMDGSIYPLPTLSPI